MAARELRMGRAGASGRWGGVAWSFFWDAGDEWQPHGLLLAVLTSAPPGCAHVSATWLLNSVPLSTGCRPAAAFQELEEFMSYFEPLFFKAQVDMVGTSARKTGRPCRCGLRCRCCLVGAGSQLHHCNGGMSGTALTGAAWWAGRHQSLHTGGLRFGAPFLCCRC